MQEEAEEEDEEEDVWNLEAPFALIRVQLLR